MDWGERKKIQPWPLNDHGGEGTGDGSSIVTSRGVGVLAWQWEGYL